MAPDTVPGEAPLVVATSPLPLDVGAILGASATYREPAHRLGRDEVLDAVGEAEGLIALLTDPIDASLLAAAPRLRVVANYAVGYDNVDVPAATARGIIVTNTPDVLTDATADFTFALLLAAARRLVEGDRLARSGTWTGWAPGQHLGADISRATLGLIGLGRIGRAVAARARGFAMEVLALDRPGAAFVEGIARVALPELLERADAVSLHCPLTPETRHIIDARALERMKPTAVLVNTARGPCVDEEALVRALAAGQIAGAGLDVFEHEPRIHPGLVASPRVVLAPHAGSATYTARRRMGEICARAIRAVLEGQRPPTIVNPEVATR
ncbi:MAG TPA: D-glycerate dehydrogenase [Kofleriaceae bacterium]|nr:D-glycerate dehydrogenase [Kofleriaceae bacterium]